MDTREREYVTLLQNSCDLRTSQDFEDYSRAISEPRACKDDEVLKSMISCIRDVEAAEGQFRQYELVDQLVVACEAFDDKKYVECFITEAPKHWNNGQNWYSRMLCNLLNSEQRERTFLSRIRDVSPAKAAFFCRVVSEIAQSIGKYDAVVRELKTLV